MLVRRLCRWVATTAAFASLSSCGGSSSPDAATYALAVLQPTLSTTLGTTVAINVNLTSDGFNGPVTLSVTGAPANWTVSVAGGATKNLVDGGIGSATINVTIPSNGTPAPAGQVLTINATASVGNKTGASTVTVANEYVLHMPNGTGSGAHWGMFNGQTIQLKSGVTFTFRNDDTIVHQLFTNDVIPGFAHEPNPGLGSGASYSVVITGTGTDTIYCNIHGVGVGTVNIVVT